MTAKYLQRPEKPEFSTVDSTQPYPLFPDKKGWWSKASHRSVNGKSNHINVCRWDEHDAKEAEAIYLKGVEEGKYPRVQSRFSTRMKSNQNGTAVPNGHASKFFTTPRRSQILGLLTLVNDCGGWEALTLLIREVREVHDVIVELH